MKLAHCCSFAYYTRPVVRVSTQSIHLLYSSIKEKKKQAFCKPSCSNKARYGNAEGSTREQTNKPCGTDTAKSKLYHSCVMYFHKPWNFNYLFMTSMSCKFLWTFAQLWKATVSFVMPRLISITNLMHSCFIL